MPRRRVVAWQWSVRLAFFGLLIARYAHATAILPVCKHGEEFWSTARSSCSPCTRCAPEFTLSPCAVHKDAICGPLSALELNWSFLATSRRSGTVARDAVTTESLWGLPELAEQRRIAARRDGGALVDRALDAPRDSNDETKNELVDEIQDSSKDSRGRRTSSEAGITWDWQTGALVLAVCACIVFFLVAGCSALVYVRQWRRMKRNFEPAGLEEISARLNLMVKAELAELAAGAPMNPGDPETRCQYLEKLLDRKRETPTIVSSAAWSEVGTSAAHRGPPNNGNLYIEQEQRVQKTARTASTGRSDKRSQIARIHHNIESILSHGGNTVAPQR